MEVLAGYGSASESDREPSPTPAGHMPGPLHVGSGALFSQLPAPSMTATGSSSLLGNLPAPKAAARRRQPIKLASTLTPLPDSDDEEDRPAKKAKVFSGRGARLTDFLPPPQNAEPASAVLGLGAGQGFGSSARAAMQVVGPSADGAAACDSDSGQTAYPEHPSNEAYRVQHDAQPAPSYSTQLRPSYSAQSGPTYTGHANGATYGPSRGPAQPYQAPVPPPEPSQDDPLQHALAAEAAKQARRGGRQPLAGAEVQFKEISAAKLTEMDPMAREAAQGARAALGTDYEQQLRKEAGPMPGKLSKRKHQIGSLFHQAKLAELEALERRGNAIKTKRETQAKYGW